MPLSGNAPLIIEGTGIESVTMQKPNQSTSDWYRFSTSGADLNTTNTVDNDTDVRLYADLTEAAGATINQLRLAFATQKFLEIQARGGSRYIETT